MPGADPLAHFEEWLEIGCAPGELSTAGAQAMCRWLASERVYDARLIGCRKSAAGPFELVIAEVDVELGQRQPVHPIRSIELIGFLFAEGKVPQAYPLRPEFPGDLPHINLAPDGLPRSLCQCEISSEELLRVRTPVMLIERSRYWLAKSAHDELHGEAQPLDPVFAGTAIPVIMPNPDPALEGRALIAFAMSDHPNRPVMVDYAIRQRDFAGLLLTCLALETPPVPHARLRSLPTDLDGLVEVYLERGIDLAPLLASAFQDWVAAPDATERFAKTLLLVVSTPVERRPGEVDGIASKGFFFTDTALAVGEALGAVQGGGGMIARPLTAVAPDRAAMKLLAIEPAELHRGFDRRLAALASGLDATLQPETMLLIGAGALGSQIALTMARGGRGDWTVVDPDHLMPHNLARHALLAGHVGAPKAEALAAELERLGGPGSARGVVSTIDDYLADCGAQTVGATVLDASASVPVARRLAASGQIATPITSVFLNPSGTDVVVLREGEQRQPRLDHLEMDYYWALARSEGLAGHLASADAFLPSGGCRHPSVRISQSRVMGAAARASAALLADDAQRGRVEIFAGTDSVTVHHTIAGHSYIEYDIGGWTVAVSSAVLETIHAARVAARECETGGIIVGSWDRAMKKGWIVALLDPPPDSEQSPAHFVRGSVGVYRTLAEIEQATASNLVYLGEWHTHPPRHSSRPSEDDRLLMDWIGDGVVFGDVPPVMMIGADDGVRLFLHNTRESFLLDGS